MEDYNRMISSRVLGNVERMIGDIPQPTMFGGKRQRDFVLASSTEYDYPATLAVGNLDSSNPPQTLGGSFWKDFGETEFLEDDREMEGGTRYYVQAPPTEGGKIKFGKVAKPIAKDLAMMMAKEGIKQGVKQGVKYAATSGAGRRRRKGSSIGKTVKSVGRRILPVAGEIAGEVFRDVIIPEGKRALREYIRSLGQSSGGEYDGEPVYAEEVTWGSGKNRRNPPPHSVRGQKSPQSNADKVASMIGRDYSTFSASEVKNPSKWIQTNYPAPKKRGRPEKAPPKPRGRPAGAKNKPKVLPKGQKKMTDYLRPEDSENDEEEDEMEGGVLIRDDPSQFHSSVYPPALASYNHSFPVGHDAFGRGRGAVCGGKAHVGRVFRKVGKTLKPAVPVAKELAMTLAKEAIKEGVKQGIKSAATGGSRKGNARGAIVREVMKKHGLSLPEASKFVKENNLY